MGKVLDMYHNGDESGVLVVGNSKPYESRRLVSRLIHNGVNMEDIYYLDEGEVETKMVPYLERKTLDYLEVSIVDFCNLNCASCMHYAPLVKMREFPDFSEFEEGFSILKTIYNKICNVRILGGEPLLNPEIGNYVKCIRKYAPESHIYVVTNGTLLLQQKDEFFDVLRDAKVVLDISYYPVLADKIDDISVYLQEKKMRYQISPMITKFRKNGKFQKPDKEYDYENIRRCPSKHSTCLEGRKISACFLPFVTKYLNQYFDMDLPIDDWMLLERNKTTARDVNEFLELPLKRCCYCTSEWKGNESAWRLAEGESTLSDFEYE